MKFNIYHAKKLANPFDMPEPATDNYTLVGQVDAADVEQAYLRTQNLGPEGWPLQSTTTKALSERIRSTSVGDIILSEDGQASRIEMIGTKIVQFTPPSDEIADWSNKW